MQSAVARHFDRAAAHYTRLRDAWPLGTLRRREQQALRLLLEVNAGDRVLDAGCGDGQTLAWLSSIGARALGIDISVDMARACHARRLDVCVQDIGRLGIRPVFDHVLCIGSLEFASDSAEAVRNLAGCLRPGGQLALLFPRRCRAGSLYAAYHRTHGISLRLFSCHEIQELLADSGLEPQSQRWEGWLSTLVTARKYCV